jgi:hypothetical protein
MATWGALRLGLLPRNHAHAERTLESRSACSHYYCYWPSSSQHVLLTASAATGDTKD